MGAPGEDGDPGGHLDEVGGAEHCALVDEVDVDAIELGAEVMERIHLALLLPLLSNPVMAARVRRRQVLPHDVTEHDRERRR